MVIRRTWTVTGLGWQYIGAEVSEAQWPCNFHSITSDYRATLQITEEAAAADQRLQQCVVGRIESYFSGTRWHKSFRPLLLSSQENPWKQRSFRDNKIREKSMKTVLRFILPSLCSALLPWSLRIRCKSIHHHFTVTGVQRKRSGENGLEVVSLSQQAAGDEYKI